MRARSGSKLTSIVADARALLGGAGLAVIASLGLVEERLSLGDVHLALTVNFLMTGVAITLLVLTERSAQVTRSGRLLQAAGAALGILAVHGALSAGLLAGAPWLVERPFQLVNDVVAVFATLGIVWACTGGIDLGLFGGMVAIVMAYRLSGGMWHLDVAPKAFSVSVQNLVMAQFAAAAIAVAVYRTTRPQAD